METLNNLKELRKRTIWRTTAIWATVALGIAVSVLDVMAQSRGSESASPADALRDPVLPGDWRQGASEAKVVLVEYGDYQCGPCAHYNLLMEKAMVEYGSRVALVFRHFPLRRTHPHAELAARAAEAAGRQGRYWQMHAVLYHRQREWAEVQNPRAVFMGYVQLLGMDAARFVSDLDDQEIAGKVESDYQSGIRAKVDGTPTLFVQGRRAPLAGSYAQLRLMLEEALGRADDVGS